MVTEIEACPHIVFRKLPNTDFFLRFILLRPNQAKMYYIVYISSMIKHLRVIFLYFGLKNCNKLSEYEFYSWVVDQHFPPKNSDQYFKFTSIFKLYFTFSAAIS